MGVPKFFRWMSERYPAISQLIAENRIPEFDNLYLDMNGIIHNCTHDDSDSVMHRVTEDKMFIAIFNYIEHLFGKIKPQKFFFMAIDGVAPRAKMNQQRARRFRTALDTERAREKAIEEGVEMPTEAAFDSNCITPGTDFMARLTQHLKYFISKKVSEDVDWQGVEIVLSGHEVPGEGEHKIMEYIRQAKAQPDYDPNRRHCLYGLDADLIMLGLLSHDPHFCLLREEVTFGRQNKTKSKELEHQNFYLMHLCIVREYLELEFQELKDPGVLGFPFDLERVIDDFILMAFFVGNDFLPNLPHLHINEGALALMFGIYKVVLPKAKGYINEGGVINMERLALLLDELGHVEYRFFESENADAAWFKGKRMEREDVMEKTKRKGQLVITSEQRDIFKKVRKYVGARPSNGEAVPYDLPVSLPARDRKFVEELAESFNLQWSTVEDGEGNRHMQLQFPNSPNPVDDTEEEEEPSDDEEAQMALLRVIKRYDNAKVVDMNADEAQAAMAKKYDEKFQAWKNKHYTDKFEWGMDNEVEMRNLTENYVQGLQWVLYYYYRGVVSWPWYYKYHYAPMISDVKLGLKADIDFKLGQPFRPYQQLMGVLPDRSKSIVPKAYWPLMTDSDSPIIDFYPRDFELDMNGKKQEWEAVVKIPFIDEKRLLPAMATKEHLLSEEERGRNSFGAALKFTYAKDLDYAYPSSLPGYFPDLEHCHCVENIYDLPPMEGLEYYVGLMNGAQVGADALASFPSLKTLPFTAQLLFHGVNVFQSDSRNESMIVSLIDIESRCSPASAKSKLGKAVHVGYPFLQEAKIVKVSDELFDYVLSGNGPIEQIPHDPRGIENFKRKADRIESWYSKKLGMEIGAVEAIIHVDMLKGLIKQDDGASIKEYGEIPGTETEYAPQVIIDQVVSEDPRFIEKSALPVEQEFPVGSKAFFLGDYAYGRPLEVVGHDDGKLSTWVSVLANKEREFGRQIVKDADRNVKYLPSYAVAKQLSLNPLALSKITSALSVMSSGLRLNLGLNLKFESKKLKVLGYSRKGATGWEYSPKAVDLICQYMTKFPEFIAYIGMNPRGDMYTDTDIYPAETAKQKMKEIGAWLKSIESKSFEKVPLEAEQLDSDVVAAIQAASAQNLAAARAEPKLLRGVPRNALLNPADAEQRVGGQRFSLGDRVVYVLSSGRVPIAQRGTVIGLTRTSRQVLLDIVFDASFISGTSLGDRCLPFFGSTVPSDSVLNISDKQVVVGSQASTANRPTHQPLPIGGRTYGMPGALQLRPAAVPTQSPWRNGQDNSTPNGGGNMQNQQQMSHHNGSPFQTGRGRSGYSNVGIRAPNGPASRAIGTPPTGPATRGTAASSLAPTRGGDVGGMRGRGRGSRGGKGYTHVDTADPMQGVRPNPNFEPTHVYNAVPPPASIDTPGRGGRGGGRGVTRGTPRGGLPGADRARARGRGRGRGSLATMAGETPAGASSHAA